MTTKKDVIIKKYLEYQNEVKQYVDFSIFPDLEDMDILDLLIYFNMYFNVGNPNPEKVIRDMIQLNRVEINENDLKVVIPISLKFIDWLLRFQKEN